MSEFICTVTVTSWSFSDSYHYEEWVADYTDTKTLRADNLVALYEVLAEYKERYEKKQAPLTPTWYKDINNYNPYTEVNFGTIFQIISEVEFDLNLLEITEFAKAKSKRDAEKKAAENKTKAVKKEAAAQKRLISLQKKVVKEAINKLAEVIELTIKYGDYK